MKRDLAEQITTQIVPEPDTNSNPSETHQ